MGVKKRQQKFGKVKYFSYLYIINNKTTITMDSRLLVLRDLQNNLSLDVEKENTSLQKVLGELHGEETTEKQRVFNDVFEYQYHWDGQRVYFSKKDKDVDYNDSIANLEVREDYNWDRNEGEPRHYYQLKFGYYGANNFDPSDRNDEEVSTLLRKHRAQEILLTTIADGKLDELKDITKTYTELRKSAEDGATVKMRLNKEYSNLGKQYTEILEGLFVEGFEFEVKGDYVKYAGREGYYRTDVRVGDETFHRAKKIRVDKVTPKQIVYTVFGSYDSYDKNLEQWVDNGELRERQVRKNKYNTLRGLKRLYTDFFINHKQNEEVNN